MVYEYHLTPSSILPYDKNTWSFLSDWIVPITIFLIRTRMRIITTRFHTNAIWFLHRYSMVKILGCFLSDWIVLITIFFPLRKQFISTKRDWLSNRNRVILRKLLQIFPTHIVTKRFYTNTIWLHHRYSMVKILGASLATELYQLRYF